MKFRVRITETSDNPMPSIEEMDALDHTVDVDADSQSHAGVLARRLLHARHRVDDSEWATRFKVVQVDEIRVSPEMVECDCGHECGAAMVMSASMGTACPDCYDTLSN